MLHLDLKCFALNGYTVSTVLVTDSHEDSSYLPEPRVVAQGSGLKTRRKAGFFVSEQEITRRVKGSQGPFFKHSASFVAYLVAIPSIQPEGIPLHLIYPLLLTSLI